MLVIVWRIAYVFVLLFSGAIVEHQTSLEFFEMSTLILFTNECLFLRNQEYSAIN